MLHASARRIYSVADLHGLRLARLGQAEKRSDLVAHRNFVHGTEIAAGAGCHAVITHSPIEAAILRETLPQGQMEMISWHVRVSATPNGFAGQTGVTFIGSYSRAPNLDAALWLWNEVMPLV